MVTLGESFRIIEGGHLWMVITVPAGDAGTFVMVNMSTLASHTEDTSCVLHAGDHPEVYHDTVIRYGFAKEWWTVGDNGYDYYNAKGQIITCEPLSRPLLRQIQESALASEFFKKRYAGLVKASLVNP